METRRRKEKTEAKGSGILEVLLAIAILTLGISAATMLTFASQSLELDTETSQEALQMAKEYLEDARAESRGDFLAVESFLPVTEDIYERSLIVFDETVCRKSVTSRVTWEVSPGRPQEIELASVLSDILGSLALGGDCDTLPAGDWDNPLTAASLNIDGQSGATDIDIQNNLIYLTTNPSAMNKDDFFVYEFNPITLTLTYLDALDVSVGLNAVDVAGNYAYLANASTTSTASSDELIIVDVSDPDNLSVVSSLTLGITPNCPSFCPGGAQSIYYLNNRVYVGTHRIGGNEFYIIDVNNPASPAIIGSANVNHNINSIIVRGNYANMATSDDAGELLIYNVGSPATITFTGRFNAIGNEDGRALELLGNKIYLGRQRTPAARNDFYILDVSNPTLPAELGSRNLGLNPNTATVDIRARGNLAFLAIDDPTIGFKILNISDVTNIVDHSVCTSLNFSENTTAIDMEDGYVFTAHRSNAELRVIRDQSTQCAL